MFFITFVNAPCTLLRPCALLRPFRLHGASSSGIVLLSSFLVSQALFAVIMVRLGLLAWRLRRVLRSDGSFETVYSLLYSNAPVDERLISAFHDIDFSKYKERCSKLFTSEAPKSIAFDSSSESTSDDEGRL